MVERSGIERDFVASEVDRYTSQPGEALACMIGTLEFDELRDRAKARLSGSATDAASPIGINNRSGWGHARRHRGCVSAAAHQMFDCVGRQCAGH